jgi:hypothetical protein
LSWICSSSNFAFMVGLPWVSFLKAKVQRLKAKKAEVAVGAEEGVFGFLELVDGLVDLPD